MTFARRISGAAALVVGLAAMPLTADAGVMTFQASGRFADGATLGGTYTVNTTTGVPISIDMTFGPPVSSDVTILDGTTTIGGNFGQFSLNNNTGPNFYPGFTFALNVASLVDYTGGPIIGTLFLNSANPSDNTGLVQGSLRVPEPASLVLLGSGFIGLAFLRSQRRAKR